MNAHGLSQMYSDRLGIIDESCQAIVQLLLMGVVNSTLGCSTKSTSALGFPDQSTCIAAIDYAQLNIWLQGDTMRPHTAASEAQQVMMHLRCPVCHLEWQPTCSGKKLQQTASR